METMERRLFRGGLHLRLRASSPEGKRNAAIARICLRTSVIIHPPEDDGIEVPNTASSELAVDWAELPGDSTCQWVFSWYLGETSQAAAPTVLLWREDIVSFFREAARAASDGGGRGVRLLFAIGRRARHDHQRPQAAAPVEGVVKWRRYEEEEEGRRDQRCSICLEELGGGEQTAEMPCSHAFHGGCLMKWLRRNRLCPYCRFEI